MSAAELPAAADVPKSTPSRAVAPHKDPSLPPETRHIIWADRQSAFLSWAGLIIAFLITLGFLAVSTWIVLAGHDAAGTVICTVDLVALVTVFVTQKNRAKPTEPPA
ncbi:hypothetical protein ACFQ68_16550 [Amycolatopsis japonica]|uniref:hypothetical protein n=1 Tax=Amycolatopsis japonica TaxID=208439 RepID=UPI00366CC9C8